MTMTERSTVVGVFHSRDDARAAIDALKEANFPASGISILSPDRRETETMAEETGTHAGSGAATGAVAGGVLGGLGGWLLGIGALAIPGIGPFIAAGAFASALGGAAIGAGVGAIAGALTGMGVPDEEASYYEGEVKSGRTLVTVAADGRYSEARTILRQYGAYDIETQDAGRGRQVSGAAAVPATTGELRQATTTTRTELPRERASDVGRDVGRRAEGDQRIELREEELQVRKQAMQTGEVGISKEVVSEQRTLEVPVTREEVVVERHAVDRRPSDRPVDDRGEVIEVPLRQEEVTLEKRPVVYEEVEVGKRSVQETQQVSGTVRREELAVEREGQVNVAGAGSQGRTTAGTGDWNTAMAGYRSRWQQRAGSSGGRWEDVEPSYRYGYDLRQRSDYRGRNWADVEPNVRRDWETRNPNTPWDRAKEGIRDAWENVPGR